MFIIKTSSRNPFVDTSYLFKLKGHTHSLSGVANIDGGHYPQLITGDCSGVFRLWNMRNFRCTQTFGGQDTSADLTCFTVVPHLHRVIAGVGNMIKIYDYMTIQVGDMTRI